MLTINTYDHEYLLHKMSMALPLIKKTKNITLNDLCHTFTQWCPDFKY